MPSYTCKVKGINKTFDSIINNADRDSKIAALKASGVTEIYLLRLVSNPMMHDVYSGCDMALSIVNYKSGRVFLVTSEDEAKALRTEINTKLKLRNPIGLIDYCSRCCPKKSSF